VLQGYAEITIQASDLSNGLIGFAENSKNVIVDEDVTPTFTLTLTRLNAFYGNVIVFWRAKMNETSIWQEDLQLLNQLHSINGTATCLADVSVCDLTVHLINDTVSLSFCCLFGSSPLF
jgi:hypothetical protein